MTGLEDLSAVVSQVRRPGAGGQASSFLPPDGRSISRSRISSIAEDRA